MDFAAARPGGGDALEALRGDALVVPAVSLGNVGQMAVDLVMNTAISAADESSGVEKVGVLRSAHVLPMAGNDPLDAPEGDEESRGRLCSSLEVYRVAARKITMLQIRAPIVEGASEDFGKELVEWIKACGFASVLVLAGSDSSANFEKEVMMHEFRYLATDAVAKEDLEALTQTGMPPLDLASSPRLPVYKAGLLSALYRLCVQKDLPLRALILFCKEGFNVPEACMMGAALQAVAKIFAAPPKAWRPPSCWQYLDGGAPELSLFQ